jgi:energy-coupling factor transporter ATP-binding protein EcfA2
VPFIFHRKPSAFPVLLLTGPVGVGKTTVANIMSTLLIERGVSHALIDLDWLRWAHPAPPDDPFHERLGIHNLAALWGSYRDAGAQRLILIDIVERRADLGRHRRALPGADITLVRLHAAQPTLHTRLAQRESGTSLEWHRQRADELSHQMEQAAAEDRRIDTDGRPAGEIAHDILAQIGWGDRHYSREHNE